MYLSWMHVTTLLNIQHLTGKSLRPEKSCSDIPVSQYRDCYAISTRIHCWNYIEIMFKIIPGVSVLIWAWKIRVWAFQYRDISELNDRLKVKRGFMQGFPNWLKLPHTVQQDPNTLITNYCASTSNRNKLVDHQKLIRSLKVGACEIGRASCRERV